MSATADAIVVAPFAELGEGTEVVVALSDPDGLLVLDGILAGGDARGSRIVFPDASPSQRERLEAFGRRGLLLDVPVEERVA